MVACVCSPAIDAEMANWVALGGANSGCCGNKAHTYGFHVPGGNVPVTDYSRSHEPGRPVNMAWACAGDFSHRNNPRLRAMHAEVLTRLMLGEFPMICEFIGQPWADQPVYYWARWNGNTTLKRYTGSGHDLWSHISWWRSRAGERANLWTPSGVTPVVQPPTSARAQLAVTGKLDRATIRRWQQIMGTPVDGTISRPRSSLVLAVQLHLNSRIGAGLALDGDGIVQDGNRYHTVAAIQRYLGTPVDGRLSEPRSMAVQAIQRRLNTGWF
jgi:hypothetical protein